MTPSKTLFYFCISFVVGIFINSVAKIPQILFWGIFGLGIAVIIIAKIYPKKMRSSIFGVGWNWVLIFGFCVVFLALGVFRFQISEFVAGSDALSKFNDVPDKVTLVGQISAEPDVRAAMQKLIVTTQKVMIGGRELNIKGRVLVTADFYNTYHYLDTVSVSGSLKTPAIINAFNYKNYLMKDGIYSVMDYPAIKVISTKHKHTIFSYSYEKILFLKGLLIGAIGKSLPQPHSFVLEGMVFGNDKNMSRELKNEFTVTGLSHVTAVSGTNIVIIINMLMIFLLAVGLWRGQAFYAAVMLIAVYIVLIGFPASGVRAAIMGSVGLFAQKLGRQNSSWRVLVLTATLMLLQNPLLLLYDVAFQLSFLAALGIMYVKPLVDLVFVPLNKKSDDDDKIKKNLKKILKFFTDILSVTLSAQIITLPIIVYNFGQLSLIAPVTNVLALPVVEALTVMGFLLSIFAAISPILGFIFAVPCWFLLAYFLTVLKIFSQPWATKMIPNVSWVWLAAYYVVLYAVIWYFQRRNKPEFIGY